MSVFSLEEKRREIQEFLFNRLKEIQEWDSSKISLDNSYDLHNEIFNTDYYIVGTYQAKKWLGSDVFDCIETIQEYEDNNFGERYTDVSDPEKLVNMYVYVIGEQLIEDQINNLLQ